MPGTLIKSEDDSRRRPAGADRLYQRYHLTDRLALASGRSAAKYGADGNSVGFYPPPHTHQSTITTTTTTTTTAMLANRAESSISSSVVMLKQWRNNLSLI